MDLFNKKRVADLENEVLRYSVSLAEARETIDHMRLVEESKKRDDTKPWVQINSDGYDDVKGVKLAMDWNDSFISYLEDLGFKGPTEQAAVQRWLAMVNLYLIEQLENEAIENDTMGTVKGVVSGY
jgi:hypothetical protein